MEWSMNAIFDSQAEIDASKDYSRIRLFQIRHAASSTPMSEIITGKPKKLQRKFLWERIRNISFIKRITINNLIFPHERATLLDNHS